VTTPFRVDEADAQAWTVVSHTARVGHKALCLVGDPEPGSNFADVARLYPYEKVSDRVRAYLMAGVEHMLMWADLHAPLKFHEEQVANVMLRPAYTLARATIEASAQAVWLMDTRDPRECIRRHLSLMRWDLQEHRKSKVDPQAKDVIKAREEELLGRVSQVFSSADIRPPNSYLDVIRAACDARSLDLDADTAERLWRASSGAAHGKYWPTLDLQRIEVGEEYEPGHHRTVQVPDAAGITEVLQAASTVSQYGVALYAQYSGVDVARVFGEAVAWVAEQVPLKPGMSREQLRQASHALPWPENNGEVRD
jgi:hypothetical protein